VSGWAMGWQRSDCCVISGCLLSLSLCRRGFQDLLKVPTCLWRWNRHSVPKRRHIKFRRRGIIQKKAYNIQNTAKVWNHEKFYNFPNCFHMAKRRDRYEILFGDTFQDSIFNPVLQNPKNWYLHCEAPWC